LISVPAGTQIAFIPENSTRGVIVNFPLVYRQSLLSTTVGVVTGKYGVVDKYKFYGHYGLHSSLKYSVVYSDNVAIVLTIEEYPKILCQVPLSHDTTYCRVSLSYLFMFKIQSVDVINIDNFCVQFAI